MSGSQRLALTLTTLVLSAALATAASRPAEAPGRLLQADDFEGDLSAWEANDESAIAIVDSGDAAHGRVLELTPSHSTLYALIRGSETWPAYRIEGEVLFPTDEHNYLGFVYNLREVGGRIDLGSVYIKGNGSYVRVNPRRDWNPARMLYEELRVALDGDAAIVTGEWQRFAVEVEGAVCHLYVADMVTPKVTFPFFELDSGKAGFKPRVVGGPVWIDNVRATSITRLSYRGRMIPAGIEYRPERMVRDWKVLGPLQATLKELEQRVVPTSAGVIENGVAHLWRDFQTDGRGAVVTGRVVDFLGEKTVAYFHSAIEVPHGSAAELEFSSIDDLTVWLNGRFEGYSYADDYAWHDFGVNPEHPPSPYASFPLIEGTNHVLIRIRGGRYASGGFFAAVKTSRVETASYHEGMSTDPVRSFASGLFTSSDLPRISIRLDDGFQYLGSTKFDLPDQARVDRHHLADIGSDGRLERLVILHFEGFLPESDETYRYGVPNAENATGPDYRFTLEPVRLGEHEYIHNTWFFAAREAVEANPDRELARTAQLLESHGYALPDEVRLSRFVRVVDDQARHEFILFYLEPLDPTGFRAAQFVEGGAGAAAVDRLSAELTGRSLAAVTVEAD